MSKKKNRVSPEVVTSYRHQKGTVKDNAIFALLHDSLFYQRIERKQKGKGSYQRKPKYVGKWLEKPDYKTFECRTFIIGFFLNKIRGNYV